MSIGSKIAAFFTQKKLDENTLEGLEEILISSDIGVTKTAELIAGLKAQKFNKEISADELKSILAADLLKISKIGERSLNFNQGSPIVLLFAGVNGSGKTTSIGKLAYQLKDQGKKVLLIAGDTFRAAAIEQLEVWAKRAGVEIISKAKTDAAGLVFDGLTKAIKEHFDIVLIDTAGRLQNKEGLMAELSKIVKVIGKVIQNAPHEKILVLDASVGQNAHSQVKEFDKTLGLTGLIITKLDGTAKAGAVIPLIETTRLPIYYIGTGEKVSDLILYSADSFIKKLFDI